MIRRSAGHEAPALTIGATGSRRRPIDALGTPRSSSHGSAPSFFSAAKPGTSFLPGRVQPLISCRTFRHSCGQSALRGTIPDQGIQPGVAGTGSFLASLSAAWRDDAGTTAPYAHRPAGLPPCRNWSRRCAAGLPFPRGPRCGGIFPFEYLRS